MLGGKKHYIATKPPFGNSPKWLVIGSGNIPNMPLIEVYSRNSRNYILPRCVGVCVCVYVWGGGHFIFTSLYMAVHVQCCKDKYMS